MLAERLQPQADSKAPGKTTSMGKESGWLA